MALLDRLLAELASFQKRHSRAIIMATAFVTLFMVVGMLRITVNTDFTKELPQDLPIFLLNDEINDKFGGQDTIFILLTIDDSIESKDGPSDIREPINMQYIALLEGSLRNEASVEGVSSVAGMLDAPYFTLDQVKAILAAKAGSEQFFSKDYKTTVIFVTTDVGSAEKRIQQLSELLREKRQGLSIPPGVKMMVTGAPPIRVTIFSLLKSDAVFTIVLASAVILVLLMIMRRSITEALLIFLPLSLGLIWTIGTLGWLSIPLSVATVGIGAMILGLGVEYGVFMLTRYKEERDRGQKQDAALGKVVGSIGTAITGSGLTTIAGFLALTLSVMPLLQKLGASLALGIFYSLAAALFVLPAFLITHEDYMHWHTGWMLKRLGKKQAVLRRQPR
jgi:uncharacterized protein